MLGGIGAEDVVEHLQVLETHLLNCLRVGAHTRRVGPDLGLGKDHTDLHIYPDSSVWRGDQRGKRR